MDIKRLGKNRRTVTTPSGTLLISYETPVAYYDGGSIVQVSDVRYSPSTSRHIYLWGNGLGTLLHFQTIPQENLDNLLRQAIGDTRLPETKARLKQGYSGNHGRLENTRNLDYDAQREFKEPVVPYHRRSRKRRVD